MKDTNRDLKDLDKIYVDVRDSAYEIINRKKVQRWCEVNEGEQAGRDFYKHNI